MGGESAGDPNLQDLLCQQMELTCQVLALNRAIAHRVGNIGGLASGSEDVCEGRTYPWPEDSMTTHAALGKWLLRKQLRVQGVADSGMPSVAQTPRQTPSQTPRQSPRSLKVAVASVPQLPQHDYSKHKAHTEELDVFERKGASELSEPLIKPRQSERQSESPRSSPRAPEQAEPKRRKATTFPNRSTVGSAPPPRKKREYNVEDRYKTTGCAQRIGRSYCFQTTTLVVIVANTIWMAVDTDLNKADVLCEAPLIFQIADNLFCAYFTFELCVRFLAFARKADALKDFSFVTDGVLVLLIVWETWIQVAIYVLSKGADSGGGGTRSASVVRIFRAFRLLRVSRMTRLLRSIPELFILVKSIGAAMRCMCVTLGMLVIVIYIFSIIFVQLLSDDDAGTGKFENVPQAMNFMIVEVLCGFDTDVFTLLLSAGFVYYLMWLVYVLMSSLSIMNVLIGILCEVVAGTADEEKERAIKNDVEHQIVLAGIDEEENCIGRQEMMTILESQSVADKLEDLGIDVHALLAFVHFFEHGAEMALHRFVELVVQFRGSKPATVRDIVDLRKYISMEISIVEAVLTAAK